MRSKYPSYGFLYAQVDRGLAELAHHAPTVPAWYEALRRLGSEPSDEKRLAVYQAVRSDETVPPEVPFFLVARHAETMMVLGKNRLNDLNDQLDAIRQQHGLDAEDAWLPGEAPEECERLEREMEEAWPEVYPETLERCGEHEMADLFRRDRDRFDDWRGRGRAYLEATLLDHDGPDVDEECLRALVSGELPEQETRRVLRLVHTVGPWHDAYERLLIGTVRRSRGE
jgi:hypothetical protein